MWLSQSLKTSNCLILSVQVHSKLSETRATNYKGLTSLQKWYCQPYTLYKGSDRPNSSILLQLKGRPQYRTALQNPSTGRETADRTEFHRKTSYKGIACEPLCKEWTPFNRSEGDCDELKHETCTPDKLYIEGTTVALCAKKLPEEVIAQSAIHWELKTSDQRRWMYWPMMYYSMYCRQKRSFSISLLTRYKSSLEWIRQRCTQGIV